MRYLVLLLPFVFVMACGGGSAEPNEATLRRDLAETWKAFKDSDYPSLYARLPEATRKQCPLKDFMGQAALGMAFFGGSFKNADLKIVDVKVSGHEATYTAKIMVDGKEISSEQEKVVWENGQWVEPRSNSLSAGPCG